MVYLRTLPPVPEFNLPGDPFPYHVAINLVLSCQPLSSPVNPSLWCICFMSVQALGQPSSEGFISGAIHISQELSPVFVPSLSWLLSLDTFQAKLP